MSKKELAGFVPVPKHPEHVGIESKIKKSGMLLARYLQDESFASEISEENFRSGVLPRLSPYDVERLPEVVRFVKVPDKMSRKLAKERSHDLIHWNKPSQFLYRLRVGQTPFIPPVEGQSRVMDRLHKKRKVVSFNDLRSDSPVPVNGRQSRSDINSKIEVNIMGQGRIPFALGSVPDVGSFLSYTTMAMANGMVFVSRDKILSNIDQQATLVGDVINYLNRVKLPKAIRPTREDLQEFAEISGLDPLTDATKLRKSYFEKLRSSWITNVGAAVEANPETAVKRANALYDKGCKLFRIYSPEGGTEIIDTANALRTLFAGDDEVKIIGGQIMDLPTAQAAEKAGCDAIIIGVAGGSQCTTSVNADIPVKTPNLLYSLRGHDINIPVGIEGGGVGTHLMTAFTLGASFVSKPGEIGISWEGSGGRFMFRDRNGKYYMPYGGEASISAK